MLKLDLGKLGFYWRMTMAPNLPPNPVPDFVDFSFAYREDLQLIIQKDNPQTWDYLERIYRENFNVGYLQEGHALAEGYGGDFIAFVEQSIAQHKPSARRVSEIGAGACYLLNLLKQDGYETVAIDPSPVSKDKGNAYGIEVIAEFYLSAGALPKSDVIVHYDVLEHIPDPVDFLRHHANDLRQGGMVIFAVPDCTPYITYGDISMLLHEHLNYFDQESLRNVVEAAGFTVLEICKSGYGGVLYCAALVSTKGQSWQPKIGTQKFEQFSENVIKTKEQIECFINSSRQPGCSLGCYVPLRAIPYLSMHGIYDGVRFFDDNPGIHGQYFDGFPIPVESQSNLLAHPVTHLLILSFVFGAKIRNRIFSLSPKNNMEICCLSDFVHPK